VVILILILILIIAINSSRTLRTTINVRARRGDCFPRR
jgi:hypothetical protein